ncbi:MAG: hypothetical protein ACXWLG_04970, partial [Myxococcaceae bacterium]
SVPVLNSPVELAAPTRYGPFGQPLQGDWVFARGAGSSAVSIIGAVNCPQQLREFGRVAPRPDSVVTALASRLTSDDRVAQLYFTTFDGNETTLWELLLPNLTRDRTATTVPATSCPAYPSTLPSYSLKPVGLFPGKVVTAMVALPTVQHPGAPPDAEEKRLVVASRLMAEPPALPGTMTELGEIQVVAPLESALLIDPIQGVFNSNTTVAESFPIKRMVTHGNVVNLVHADGGTITIDIDGGVVGAIADVVMDAGTRIFAVMDEASCGGTADCVGVLAVDLDRTTPLQATVLPDGGAVPDGGTVPRVRYPVAIDGFDNLRDLLDESGNPFRNDGGIGNIQVPDTFYRAPATFPDGGPRDSNRMLVIRFGNNTAVGIVQDVVVEAAGRALYFDGFPRQYGLLGHVTITGFGNSIPAAQIFAFDGMTLRQLNYSPNVPTIVSQQSLFGNGSQASFQGGPQNVQIGLGIWPYSELVAVQYEGIVSGIVNEPLDAGLGAPRDGVWPLSINSRTAVEKGYVQPGDIVVPVDGTNTECQYAFPILPGEDGGLLDLSAGAGAFLHTREQALASVIDGGLLDGGGVLVLSDGTTPTIASCPPMLSFNVRSSGLAPQSFTVTGTFSGWLGRLATPPQVPGGSSLFQVGENSTPTFVRFWRPSVDAGTSATELTKVGFSFELDYLIPYVDPVTGQAGFDAGVDPLLTGGDIYGLRGSGYTINFLNGYTPASVALSPTSLQVQGLNLPGALSLYQPQIYPTLDAAGAERVFVLYPGGNLIVDFSPTTVSYSVPDTAYDIGVHY